MLIETSLNTDQRICDDGTDNLLVSYVEYDKINENPSNEKTRIFYLFLKKRQISLLNIDECLATAPSD